jgi:hypothetical protein
MEINNTPLVLIRQGPVARKLQQAEKPAAAARDQAAFFSTAALSVASHVNSGS